MLTAGITGCHLDEKEARFLRQDSFKSEPKDAGF
jgi:hypothetical protein